MPFKAGIGRPKMAQDDTSGRSCPPERAGSTHNRKSVNVRVRAASFVSRGTAWGGNAGSLPGGRVDADVIVASALG